MSLIFPVGFAVLLAVYVASKLVGGHRAAQRRIDRLHMLHIYSLDDQSNPTNTPE